ncbi:MAG: GNAT family N-acetyltransferase [Synergistaceae bacterium]|nr:GNAT family N-acetyltransferase [Synergistaceae bacterium]
MITYLGFEDMQAVLGLASQVESLFGPMVGVADFEKGLEDCLKTGRVLGCKVQNDVCGAAIVDRDGNELCWFVVDSGKRGLGIGARMLEKVIVELDPGREMTVQTFAPGVPEGEAARRLYMKYGFADREDGGLNPAGIRTVIMVREKK